MAPRHMPTIQMSATSSMARLGVRTPCCMVARRMTEPMASVSPMQKRKSQIAAVSWQMSAVTRGMSMGTANSVTRSPM